MRVNQTLDELQGLLTQAREGLSAALPNVITALVVLAVGWTLAALLRAAVNRGLRRLSRSGERGVAGDAWQQAVDDHKGGQLAAGGVYWLVLLTAIVLAVDALDIALLRRWMTALGTFLPRLVAAVAVLLGGLIVGRFAGAAVLKTAFRLPPTQTRNLARVTHAGIVVAAALIAASQLGLDVSLLTSVFLITLTAALGGAALAFALGARDTMANILAMHYVSQAYEIGQVVRVGSDEGRIVRKTRTCVYLLGADGEISIPGRSFADSRCVLLDEERAP